MTPGHRTHRKSRENTHFRATHESKEHPAALRLQRLYVLSPIRTSEQFSARGMEPGDEWNLPRDPRLHLRRRRSLPPRALPIHPPCSSSLPAHTACSCFPQSDKVSACSGLGAKRHCKVDFGLSARCDESSGSGRLHQLNCCDCHCTASSMNQHLPETRNTRSECCAAPLALRLSVCTGTTDIPSVQAALVPLDAAAGMQ